MKPEQVPDEVAQALIATLYGKPGLPYREALAVAINAWPGMQHRIHIEHAIILPLPEKTDE